MPRSGIGALLTGILSGAGGLPKGVQEAEDEAFRQARAAQQQEQFDVTTDLQRKTLAESERHRRAIEDQAYVDLPPALADALKLTPGRNRAALATLAASTRPKGFTLGEGQQQFGPEGNLIASGPPKHDRATEGDRRAAEIHRFLAETRGLTPGTPQYETEFMNWRNRGYVVYPGGGTFPATDLVNRSSTNPPAAAPAAQPAAPTPTLSVPITPPPVSSEQVSTLADFRTLAGQMSKLRDLYKPEYVGPVEGRLGALKNLTGIGITPEESALRAEMSGIQNTLIYLKSGKQINEQEYARLARELPDVNDPEVVFKAKLDRAGALMAEMLKNREAEFKSRGYRGSGPGSAPASPAPKPAPAAPAPATGGWGQMKVR